MRALIVSSHIVDYRLSTLVDPLNEDMSKGPKANFTNHKHSVICSIQKRLNATNREIENRMKQITIKEIGSKIPIGPLIS